MPDRPPCPACDEDGVRKDCAGSYYRCSNQDCPISEFHTIGQ